MPGKTPKRTLPMPPEWIERKRALYEVKDSNPIYPKGRFKGRGIVTCAGGRYFPPAWVLINMLRKHGCELPIEIWHLGPNEINDSIRECVTLVPDVELIDAYEQKMKHPVRKLGGWESKPFAIINSKFEEVLFLDGDNVPTKNPEFLFEHKVFKQSGAVFWPDYERLAQDRSIWQICGVDYINEAEFETGQILVDKRRCWLPLLLTMHMNEWSEFYYNHIWGDKDTFHMAWHVAEQAYHMIKHPIHRIPDTMCQHDPEGEIIFQHRNLAKFQILGNKKIPGFQFEEECINFVTQLNPTDFGEGRISQAAKHSIFSASAEDAYKVLIKNKYFKYKKEGSAPKILEFKQDGGFGKGSSVDENGWYLGIEEGAMFLYIINVAGEHVCRLKRLSDSRWKGNLIGKVRYNVELKRK